MTKGLEYFRSSRYEFMGPSKERQGLPQPPLQLPLDEGLPLIALPDPQAYEPAQNDLKTVFNIRRSCRKYDKTAISLEALSYLLWVTQGVQRISDRPVTFRPVPSAGARHAFETFLLINRVDDLVPGLYRYAAIEHSLACLVEGTDINGVITQACLDQPQVANSAVTFLWSAVYERMYWRYGERSIRYLHLDAGHVCQNLYLAAESMGCGVCAIAAFNDDLTNQALGLDGESQFVVYIASLGKRVR